MARGRTLAVITPRRSPLTELSGTADVHLLGTGEPEAFVALRREVPELAILIDDVENLDGTPIEQALLEAARLVDTAEGLIAASADLHRAPSAYRGLVPELARHATGLLLGARSPADGELFHLRAEPAGHHRPGRGLLVADGAATPIQLAIPAR